MTKRVARTAKRRPGCKARQRPRLQGWLIVGEWAWEGLRHATPPCPWRIRRARMWAQGPFRIRLWVKALQPQLPSVMR
jgi:hypothetical protein